MNDPTAYEVTDWVIIYFHIELFISVLGLEIKN